MSKRLVFIVEGDTEIQLVHELLIPYFIELGFHNPMNAQTTLTSRKKNKKGGVVNYEYLKNDLKRVFAQGNVIVTTLLDFFRLPTSFPHYSKEATAIPLIEQGMKADFEGENYIPYIQQYELEALFFSNEKAFDLMIDEPEQQAAIEDIINQYPNPEDINGGATTAPSKRLERILNYQKTIAIDFILEELDVPTIRAKCPRFDAWIGNLVECLKEEK